jgi:anti-anti-sigma regulatory factor
MLSVNIRRAGETVTLMCIGRIVVGQGETLEQIATTQRARVLVIDLAGVETIDAAGLGTLVRIKMWSEDSRIALKLTNPNKLVREEQAWVLALAGYRKLAIENADVASRIPQNFGTKLRLASALALAGESKRAMDVAAEVAKSRPEDTLVKAVDVPLVQAIAALNNGKAFEAIEILKAASPYDKANTRVLYVRGLAFLKARQGNDAAQEFQKVLSLRNFAADDPVLSMAHLGLARARAMSGDAASARTAYQDFFALWKDADPDIPILREAKAEYAKLR